MGFNIGPLELLVLAFVGLIVLGPDKLPGLARDAARLIRTLRELATGARTQLRDELGPELADLDLRSLNPRTAIQRAIMGDDDPAPRATATTEPVKPLSAPLPPTATDGASSDAAPFDPDAT
jgi:sec-independent protein translocase protein TatB